MSLTNLATRGVLHGHGWEAEPLSFEVMTFDSKPRPEFKLQLTDALLDSPSYT